PTISNTRLTIVDTEEYETSRLSASKKDSIRRGSTIGSHPAKSANLTTANRIVFLTFCNFSISLSVVRLKLSKFLQRIQRDSCNDLAQQGERKTIAHYSQTGVSCGATRRKCYESRGFCR